MIEEPLDTELDKNFWQDYIEERERLNQLRDEAATRQFWAFKFPERLI
jgi:hypothetical protein